MDDTEEQLDEDELGADDEVEAPEPPEPDEGEAVAAPGPSGARARAGEEDVESIDLIVKKEARAGGEDDDEPAIAIGRDEKLEPLAVKVVPPQETEFVCTKCFLVKHRSQLKDAKRKRCRDCA
jgi:hypothetical protein